MTALDATLEARLRGEVLELRSLLREAIYVVHQTGSLRDHADPSDKTGWNLHGIETCADPLCVDALAALAAGPVA